MKNPLSAPERPALLHLCWLARGHDWRLQIYLFAVAAGPLLTPDLIADISLNHLDICFQNCSCVLE